MKKFLLVFLLVFISVVAANAQNSAWAERIAGTSGDSGESIAVDTQGNTYVAGSFQSSTLTFNNGITLTRSGSSGSDAYIAKYNPAGLCLWAEKIAGTWNEVANSIAVDSGGNVYVVGSFNLNILIFNNGITLTNTGSSDVYIAKYNNQGICLWAEKIAGTNHDYANSITVDQSGYVYVAGHFQSSTITFNSGISLTNDGFDDGYIAKYSSSGLCLWAEKISGTHSDYAKSVAVDSNGNVYVSGYYYNSDISFNNGISLTNNALNNAFVAKYDFQGLCL